MPRALSLAAAVTLLALALFPAAEGALDLRAIFSPLDPSGAPLPGPEHVPLGPLAAPMIPLPLTLVVLAAMAAARARWILPVAAIAVSMAIARPYGSNLFQGVLPWGVLRALLNAGLWITAALTLAAGLLALRRHP